MSTLTVSTINTSSNTTPLTLTTGNNTVGIDIIAANSTIRINGTNFLKNGTTLGAGKQTMWIPAGAIVPNVTSGPALNGIETTTNKIQVKTLDFDPATIEKGQVAIRMPKSWDEGSFTYSPVWSQMTNSAGSAVWNLAGVAISTSDSLDAAFSTPVSVSSSGGTANTVYFGTESSAVVVAGSPIDNDYIVLEISRYATSASDTLAIDARLHGIQIYYTANTDSDL